MSESDEKVAIRATGTDITSQHPRITRKPSASMTWYQEKEEAHDNDFQSPSTMDLCGKEITDTMPPDIYERFSKLSQLNSDTSAREASVGAVQPAAVALAASSSTVVVAYPAPVELRIPYIARGYEEIYRRFINGRLVYRGPAGERTFAFLDLTNPLVGEFDLSGLTFEDSCDKKIKPVDKILRIKLGYRSVKEDERKVTVWILPKFVATKAHAFERDYEGRPLSWSSNVGIFWSYGNRDLKFFYWLTSNQFDEINTKNLYECCIESQGDAKGPTPVKYGCGGMINQDWWPEDYGYELWVTRGNWVPSELSALFSFKF